MKNIPDKTEFNINWNAYIGDWIGWRHYNFNSYAHWEITSENHEELKPGKYMYVLTSQPTESFRYLPVDTATGEQYRSHSQLAGGERVLAAGYFQVGPKNTIEWVDNASGHYKPDANSIETAIDVLENLGFDISETESRAHMLNNADTHYLPWLQQTMLNYARIAKGWVHNPPGRYKGLPVPDEHELGPMPY
ncbi:hypothetical protein L3V82_03480 [Thiotrichales bacterium 19S3-7]|nr:hypothetical protein [Thiotrichales bacterium 19S3-7]MCF6801292.1 hypothetical protein [Thiotrichales bacterium 19S3-11]